MKGLQKSSLLVLVAMVGGHASAYEISTHALITEIAYQRSTLNPATAQSIVPVLGFDRLDDKLPFRENDVFLSPIQVNAYFDDPTTAPPSLPPLTTTQRRIIEGQDSNVIRGLQDRNLVPQSPGDELVTVDAWLMRGAIREDDNDGQIFGAWFTTDDRGEDPYGPLLRAGRHFYDPYLDRAYTFINQCNTYGCVKSPSWSLGRTAPFNPPADSEELNRRNHFTWQDARNNYWWALTSVRKSGAIATSFERTNSAYERTFRWSTTIDSLGHVIHLLQDAAQPQHTRNDAHAPPLAKYSPSAVDGEGEADAAYEAYTDNRVLGTYSGGLLGNPLAYMDGGVPSASQLPPLVYGSYPNVAFAAPSEYFSTRHIETSAEACGLGSPTVELVCARRGLADYSNRGFFTAGTMPGMRECANPGPGGAACTVYQSGPTYPMPEEASNPNDWESLKIQSGIYTNGKVVWLTEFARTVPDKIAPSHDSGLLSKYHGKVPLMTQGIFRNVLDLLPPEERVGVDQTLRYNNLRYDADVLVPRAIGYSAGMIDYFFRGRMVVEAPPAGLFALTDQGIPHTVDADGYPICSQTVTNPDGGPALCTQGRVFGFTALQMKVRNDTPKITESGNGLVVPQNLTNGKLVAVARYHRDRCYRPDLSGAISVDANAYWAGHPATLYGPACPDQASWIAGRTSYQEISVSVEIPVDANGMITVQGQTLSINDTNSVLVPFDFSGDPVPVNATDLFIQVVFRGNMGSVAGGAGYVEPDGIAVGSLDVSEPTFMPLLNQVDYIYAYNQWMLAADARAQYPNMPTFYDPSNIAVAKMCIGDRLVMAKGDGSSGSVGIPSANIIRFAVILDKGVSHRTRTRATWWVDGALDYETYYIDSPSGAFVGRLAQAGKEKNPDSGPDVYTAGAMFQGRGRVFGDWYNYFYKDYQSTTWDWGTGLPTALLPPTSGGLFLPVRADHLYLNNPQPGLCGTSSIAPTSPQHQSGGVSVGMDGHRE